MPGAQSDRIALFSSLFFTLFSLRFQPLAPLSRLRAQRQGLAKRVESGYLRSVMSDDAISVLPAPLSPAEPDWKAIEQRYLDGEELRDIASDYGVNPGAIATRAWRGKWRARQFKWIEENKLEVEREVRGCLAVSVLKDARSFQREDPPSDPSQRLTLIKARRELLETAARLFQWNDDPLAKAKPARCLEV